MSQLFADTSGALRPVGTLAPVYSFHVYVPLTQFILKAVLQDMHFWNGVDNCCRSYSFEAEFRGESTHYAEENCIIFFPQALNLYSLGVCF